MIVEADNRSELEDRRTTGRRGPSAVVTLELFSEGVMTMMPRRRVCSFLFLAAMFGTTVLAPSLARGDPEPISVTAKLVEIPSKFPPDDLYDYAYVMRYE